MEQLPPIRAPSPCQECPVGIRRSGSCDDCLGLTGSPPPIEPRAQPDPYEGYFTEGTITPNERPPCCSPIPVACSPRTESRRIRNQGECEWCPSRDLAEGSVLCVTCDALPYTEAEYCSEECGRQVRPVGLFTCRWCQRSQEITQAGDRLLAELLEEAGCLGCGLEGYGGDYCSRDCLLERTGQS